MAFEEDGELSLSCGVGTYGGSSGGGGSDEGGIKAPADLRFPRAIAHGVCLQSGTEAPDENHQTELADEPERTLGQSPSKKDLLQSMNDRSAKADSVASQVNIGIMTAPKLISKRFRGSSGETGNRVAYYNFYSIFIGIFFVNYMLTNSAVDVLHSFGVVPYTFEDANVSDRTKCTCFPIFVFLSCLWRCIR